MDLSKPTIEPTDQPRPRNRKELQKEQTRLRLVEAALTLFAEQGYDETTTSHIAALAGVTERTFYLHFATKADAIIELTPEWAQTLVSYILTADPDGSDIATLERALLSWLEPLVDSEHHRVRLLLRAAQTSPTIRGKQLDALDTLYETAAAALAERSRRKRATLDMRVAAAVAIRLLHASLIEWATATAPGDVRRIAERHFSALHRLFPAN